MKLSKTVTRWTARFLLICFAPFALFVPASQAAIIGTDQIITNVQAQADRAHLNDMLNRADLREQLHSVGVDPAQIQDRIASLTDDEVALLNEQLDQLPAGGDVLGLAVFVFLVLLITDILGYTEIFPFIKKTAQ